MAEKQADKGKVIVAICAAVAAVIIVVVAAIVISTNKGLGDDYFKSDDTKYVLSLDVTEDDIDPEDESAEYAPIRRHAVYDYKEDEVTGVRVYYEYQNNADAKKAYDYLIQIGEAENYKEMHVDGKYVVTVINEEEYQDITASDVKQSIEFMEAIKNMTLEDLEETEGAEE